MASKQKTAPLVSPEPLQTADPASADPTNLDAEPLSESALAEAKPADERQETADLFADPETDAMVDDITVREGDELLAVQDARAAGAELGVARQAKTGFGARLRGFFGGWWRNRLARYATILVVLCAVGALGAMPTSRYLMLNTVGVRSAASLTIIDNTTQLPLKNVTVELGDHKTKSNEDGLVKLSGLKLGTQSLAISQAGFATISKTVTLGYGSNPLGDFTLQAVGTQFRFKLVDFLSGKPVTSAEISSGDANAQADKNGQLVLTLGLDASTTEQATIRADGYRSEKVGLEDAEGKPLKQNQTIVMAPSQKEVFVSKQSGRYDLYKIDIDGKNKQLLLAAAGQEDAAITAAASPDGTQVALISRRDDTQNQDGFPLQSLTIVDVENGTKLTLDHSERMQVVDWIGTKLVYVKIKAGTSAGNADRYQLMSYDYDTISRLQLASANNFTDVISAKGTVYFAASNDYQGGTSQLVKINPDSTGKQVLLDKTDVWNIARSSYDSLNLSVYDGRYEFKIGETAAKKIDDSPGDTSETRFYLDAVDGKHSLWTENRDGKGTLLVYNAETTKDTTLVSQSGLTYPVRWLNARTIVYRVSTPAETADYAVSLDGGSAKKITDLTATSGLGRWNYR